MTPRFELFRQPQIRVGNLQDIMNILVIGGTGFISTRVVYKLLEAGYHVTALNRGTSRNRLPEHENLTFVMGDRNKEHSLRNVASQQTFDAVYDMVAYLPEESELAIRVFRGKIGRFIHCSTISVYMVSYEVQCPITEDQDKGALMQPFPRNPFGMEYGINKRKCEDILWNAHHDEQFPVSMLRPTYVCGPHDPVKRDFFWIERILDGKPLLAPGSGDFAFQHVYVEDVAQAFVDLLKYPDSVGQAYNVAGEEIFSLNDYLKTLCRMLDRNPEIIHVDQQVFDAQSFSMSPGEDVFPFNSRRTAVFSLDKIKRHLQYRPTPFLEWMPLTIDWYQKQYDGHSAGYTRREEEIQFANCWLKIRREIAKGLQ